MNAHELLISARAMIPTPNDWTKGVNARNAEGEEVDPCHPNAICYCTMGAFEKADSWSDASNKEYKTALQALNAALPQPYFDLEIYEYQDLPETTHADVLALFDRAIAATAPEAV